MDLVIEISKKDKSRISDLHFIPEELKFEIGRAIMTGTPLPEGRRIGDLDAILLWLIGKGVLDKLTCGEVASVFKQATLVVADKELEE